MCKPKKKKAALYSHFLLVTKEMLDNYFKIYNPVIHQVENMKYSGILIKFN